MNKKGLSGDVILQIGLLTIAAFTTLLAANLFYDSVETAVYGDPYLAVRTMGSYAEFIDASPMPMTIYLEVPQDLMGNPGYGTVLYDPETCEFKVNKYPQNYMSSIILNHAWDTITLEEAATIGALRKWRKAMSQKMYGAAASQAAGLKGLGGLEELSNTQYNKNLQKSIEKQGYSLEDIATKSGKNADDFRAVTETTYGGKTRTAYNPNANKDLLAALDEAGVPKNKINKIEATGQTRFTKKMGFVSRVKSGIAARAANVKTGIKTGIKSVLSAGYRTVSSTSAGGYMIRSTKRAADKVGKVASNFAGKSKVGAGKFAKAIANKIPFKLTERVTIEGIEKIVIPTPLGPIPIGYITGLILAGGGYALEYVWTYLPISHFIDRSQDATDEINKEWASYSCKSNPDKVIVSKPNCESEPYLIYPDFGSDWLEDKGLGVFSGVTELLEQSFSMPASQPTTDTKSYDSIENAGNECIDAHSYLLSEESSLFSSEIDKENPKFILLTAPFMYCFEIMFLKPSWGSGCNLMYNVGYLSMWAAPASDRSTEEAVGATMTGGLLGGGVGYLMGGPAGAAIGTLVAGSAANNPIDSTRLLPTMSKSAGMIDQDKYYYIEDPYLISLSKDVKDGEMVFEVNKEL